MQDDKFRTEKLKKLDHRNIPHYDNRLDNSN